MDMKQLRYFTTVAQLQNFSRAADLLHVSQSSLSKQIARLESELGVQLFDRNGKKIRLNSAGMRFYDYSSMVLREIETAEEDIRFLVRSQDRRIRIGTAGTSNRFLACMAEFLQQHPDTEYIVNSRLEDDEHVNINDYDALICPNEYRFEKLSGHDIYEEDYFFAVPAASPLAGRTVFSTQMLNGHPLVFLRGSLLTPEFPFRVCSAITTHMDSFCFVDSRDMHRRIIGSGMACGFVPRSESDSYRADPAVHLLPIMNNRFSRTMKICFLREKHLSELGSAFRSFVFRYFQLA